MPNGGINVYNVLHTIYRDQPPMYDLRHIHQKLGNLFKLAILPMNAMKIYHCDIKSQNIVYDNKDEKIRLIDWGLAFIDDDKRGKPSTIPHEFRNYSFNFNFPLGTCLLSEDFESMYSHFIRTSSPPLKRNWKFDFLVDFIIHRLQYGRRDHFEYMNPILLNIYRYFDVDIQNKKYIDHEDFGKYNWMINFIAHYLLTIIDNAKFHGKQNIFSPLKYFQDCFLVEVDICGFLSIYADILPLLKKHILHTNIAMKMKYILRTYVYNKDNHDTINIEEIQNDLDDLQNIINSSPSESKRGGNHKSEKKKKKKTKTKTNTKTKMKKTKIKTKTLF